MKLLTNGKKIYAEFTSGKSWVQQWQPTSLQKWGAVPCSTDLLLQGSFRNPLFKMRMFFSLKTLLEKEMSLLIAIISAFYTSVKQLENIRWQKKLMLICFAASLENKLVIVFWEEPNFKVLQYIWECSINSEKGKTRKIKLN